MDTVSLLVIIFYLVSVTAAGSYLARKSKGSDAWAIAGGNMGVLMVAVGVAGTRIGGVGTYGVAGNVMQTGLWNLWYGVNTFLALALVGLFFAVPYRRLRLHTVSQIFFERFGSRRCQWLTSLCVQTEYLIVNILEPFVIGSILTGITGLPFGITVFIGAFVIILYTALGGLWGSAVTNLIHCTVVVVGLAVVGIFGMRHLGGWDGVVGRVNEALSSASPPIDGASWWSFVGLGWGAVLAMFFSATIHTPAASIYVNFSSAARRERDILPAFLLGGLIASVMPFLAGWVGIQTLAKYGAESGLGSYTAITQLAVDLNPWVGGIALAAILAAVISSGGPILLASSTMFVQDWLPFARRLGSSERLFAFRLTTVIYGLVAAFIAWRGDITSILDLLLLGFAMVVPPAIAVGYLIYWRRTTERACFWGMFAGYGTGLIWYGLIRWAELAEPVLAAEASAGRRLFHRLFVDGGGVDPSYPTTLIPLLLIPILSLATAAEESERKESFYSRLAKPKAGDAAPERA